MEWLSVLRQVSLYIFECWDQYHFYKLTSQQHKKTKRRRYMWTHAGICPPKQWEKWVKEWRLTEQELDDAVYEFLDQEEEEEDGKD